MRPCSERALAARRRRSCPAPSAAQPHEDRSPTRPRISIPAKYSALPRYLALLTPLLPVAARDDEILSAIGEALANAIVHGALGLSSRERDEGDPQVFFAQLDEAERRFGEARWVSVAIRRGRARLEIIVGDCGHGFDWRASTIDGHGVSILRRVFDEVRWNRRGNAVHLILHGDRAC